MRRLTGSQFGNRLNHPPSWPDWVKPWVANTGSLTAQLINRYGEIQVDLRAQGRRAVSLQQAHWLRLKQRSQMRFRRVLLKACCMPVVAAESWVTLDGPRCDWSFWSTLGNQSLGSELFANPQVRRQSVQYFKLTLHSAWVQQVLGHSLFHALQATTPMSGWYVRQACYVKPPGFTPLWVAEIFLPTLHDCCVGN